MPYMHHSLCFLLAFIFIPLSVSAKPKGFAHNAVVEYHFGKDQKGNEIDLSDYRGKPVAIIFWSTERTNSITLLQHFEQIQRLEKEKIKVIAVNVKDERRTFKKIARQFSDFTSSLVHDKKGRITRDFGMDRSEFIVLLNKYGQQKGMYRSYKEADLDTRYKRIKKLIQ